MEGEEERSNNEGSFSKASIPKRIAIVAAGAIVNIICNIVLIPRYEAVGSCIATIAAELSVPIVQYIFFRKELNYKKLISQQIIFVVTALMTIVFLGIIQNYFAVRIVNLIILLIIGSIFYIFTCILLHFIFRRKELIFYLKTAKEYIKVILNKKKIAV